MFFLQPDISATLQDSYQFIFDERCVTPFATACFSIDAKEPGFIDLQALQNP